MFREGKSESTREERERIYKSKQHSDHTGFLQLTQLTSKPKLQAKGGNFSVHVCFTLYGRQTSETSDMNRKF